MRVRNLLEERLSAKLAPQTLRIEDQSAQHAGHAGSRPEGETHFRVELVSPAFAGLSRVARQRLVIEAVGDLMDQRIHALSISALTPEEASAKRA
jgi:BolA family transcriptional regulator, general stress-responsive regulator